MGTDQSDLSWSVPIDFSHFLICSPLLASWLLRRYLRARSCLQVPQKPKADYRSRNGRKRWVQINLIYTLDFLKNEGTGWSVPPFLRKSKGTDQSRSRNERKKGVQIQSDLYPRFSEKTRVHVDLYPPFASFSQKNKGTDQSLTLICTLCLRKNKGTDQSRK